MKNLAVLTGDETGDDGIEDTDTPEGIPTTREACLAAGGNWNMASVAENCGFESVKCEYSGKISIFGISIEGSYKKGEEYNIPWVLYKCVPSESNCCMKQGLYSGEMKLA